MSPCHQPLHPLSIRNRKRRPDHRERREHHGSELRHGEEGITFADRFTQEQGLTLVPISAQLELTLPLPAQQAYFVPHITQRNPWMCSECAQVELLRERCVPKVLKLSSEVSECKPLPRRWAKNAGAKYSDICLWFSARRQGHCKQTLEPMSERERDGLRG